MYQRVSYTFVVLVSVFANHEGPNRMMIGTAKLACLIATRYAISRLAVGPTGQSDTPLLALQVSIQVFCASLAKI